MAMQAAANGQLARATAEPFVASLVNVTVGLVALGVVGLVALATVSLDAPPANPLLYAGGLLGGFVVVVSATAVQTLGVLRLGLATVAGQTAGALIVDLVAPAPGESVTAATVLGVVLTMAAVAVSGRGRPSSRPLADALSRPLPLRPMPAAAPSVRHARCHAGAVVARWPRPAAPWPALQVTASSPTRSATRAAPRTSSTRRASCSPTGSSARGGCRAGR